MSASRFSIVRGGRVLDVPAGVAAPADLLIEDGRIRELGPPGMAAPAHAAIVDASDRLVIPGLVNAHTHGHGSLGKGAGDRWTLELLLNAGPWITGQRATEHKYLSALVGALEMLRKGCTACYDLYFEFPLPTLEGMDAAARGYADAGMRAVIAPMIADCSFFQAIPGLIDALPADLRREVERMRLAPAQATVDACAALLRDWPHDRDRLRLALAPTIPLHCADEFITACGALAREHGVGLHTHLAESKLQALIGMRRYGRTLTAHLDKLGFMGPDFTGAHCVWLDGDDVKRFAGNGASVAHNPGSNLRLGSGIAPARQLLDAGVNVGVGTDGVHCADNQNMFEAMRFAAYVSRIRDHDPQRWLSAREVLGMATAGSARAMGFGEDIGRIAPGAWADLVFLDLAHINWIPANDPVNQLVNTEDGAAVDGVMVGGRIVLWGGRFTSVNLARVRAQVDQAWERLLELNHDARELAARLDPVVSHYCVGLSRSPYHVHAMASVGEAH
jgi:guanine deaminase